jgi:hypothetical protein
MAAPSTAKALACRELGAPNSCEAYIEWAIGRLESGDDSPNLCMLAGSTPSDDPSRLQRLFENSLYDLGIPSVRGDAAIKFYVAELLSALVRSEASAEDVLGYLQGVCVARDYAGYLYDFYLLYYALIDLEQYGNQHYWPSATPENIQQHIRATAQSWLAEHLPPTEPSTPAEPPRA